METFTDALSSLVFFLAITIITFFSHATFPRLEVAMWDPSEQR